MAQVESKPRATSDPEARKRVLGRIQDEVGGQPLAERDKRHPIAADDGRDLHRQRLPKPPPGFLPRRRRGDGHEGAARRER